MNEVWMLTAGEGDDREILGVVLGDEEQAREKALRLSSDRVYLDSNYSNFLVDVEKMEVL